METCSGTCINSKVFDSVATSLRKRIVSGEAEPGSFLGTELGFARETGLSRKSIRSAIDQLQNEGLIERKPGKGVYVRHPSASKFRVEIIVPSIGDSMSAAVCHAAQLVGRNYGIDVRICDAHRSLDEDISIIRKLLNNSLDGALISSLHSPLFAEAIYDLKCHRFPFVLIDQELQDIAVPSVISDNYSGGYMVGQHLFARGHRKIGMIGLLKSGTVAKRLQGLRDALSDAGVILDRSLVCDTGGTSVLADAKTAIEHSTRELLTRKDRPTAIFYSADGLAALGYQVIKSMGLSIPDDVSVVGFDGSPLSGFLEPHLATIKQDGERMGCVAMEKLWEIISGTDVLPETAIIPTEWIEGNSIANLNIR